MDDVSDGSNNNMPPSPKLCKNCKQTENHLFVKKNKKDNRKSLEAEHEKKPIFQATQDHKKQQKEKKINRRRLTKTQERD